MGAHHLYINFDDSFMGESKAILIMELVEGKEMFEHITELGSYNESDARVLFE